MKRKSILSRSLSLVLMLMMVLGNIPAWAFEMETETSAIDDFQEAFDGIEAEGAIDSTEIDFQEEPYIIEPENVISGIEMYTDVTSGTAIVYAGQTEDGDYTIGDAEQLVTLAEKVNEGISYSNSTFTLLNDINLSSVCGETEGNWTPIGNLQANPFSGIFDGDSNIISGLYISGNLSNQGLFGYVNNAEIKNLAVDGELINSTKNAKNISGIAANAFDSTFINCTNNVNILSTATFAQFGGIVGNGTGLIFNNCVNEVNLTISSGSTVGGIIGMGDDITFNNCVNEGNIIAKGSTGGIVGSGKTIIFNACVNEGNITASSTKAGGIVGELTKTSSSFINCRNIANIEGASNVGGIVGVATGSPSINIENCYNSGRIKAMSFVGGIGGAVQSGTISDCINEGDVISEAINGFYVGGIIGYVTLSQISGCTNKGTITNKGTMPTMSIAGGIAGQSIDTTLNNSVNSGYINGSFYVGGVVGKYVFSNLPEHLEFSGNRNTGRVEGIKTTNVNIDFIGGLVGSLEVINGTKQSRNVIVENCYNTGDVIIDVDFDKATSQDIGGLFGKISANAAADNLNLEIHNCYSSGIVKGGKQIGGMVGLVQLLNSTTEIAAVEITNSYSSSVVTTNVQDHKTMGAAFGIIKNTGDDNELFLSNIFALECGIYAIGTDEPEFTELSDVTLLKSSQMTLEGFSTLLGGTYTKLSPELYLDDDGDYDEETYAKYHEIYGDYSYPILRIFSGLKVEKTYNVKFEGAGYTTVIANDELTYATTVAPGGSVTFSADSNYKDEVEVLSVFYGDEKLTPNSTGFYTVDNINDDIVITIETEGEPTFEDTEAAYEIAFEFTDAGSDVKIEDAVIAIEGITPEEGIYKLKKGTYTVTVTKDNYYVLTGEIEVSRDKTEFSAALYPSNTEKHKLNLAIGTGSIATPHIVYLYNGDFVIAESNPSPSMRYEYSKTEFENIPAGEYTYWAKATEGNGEWSGISMGGGPLTIGEDKEVNLRIVYFGSRLKNDSRMPYTMTIEAADGTKYLPGSSALTGGIARAFFIVPSKPDGAEYKYAFHSSEDYWASSGTTYIYDDTEPCDYRSLNLSDSRKFVIAPKVPVSLTVPTGSKLGMYHRVCLYRPMEELSPNSVTDNKDGTTTYIYDGPAKEDLQYEFTLDGYVKTAELFSLPETGETNKSILLDSMTKDTGKDLKSGNDADIVMNAPDSKYIELKTGEKYELYCFRNWQPVNSITDNQYVDPEYKIEVIYGDSVKVTDEYYAGAVIKAVDGKSGISMVRVTYGPLEYITRSGKSLYSKLWEQNTVVLVFNVNPKGTATIDTGINQIEFETEYYTRSINGIEQNKDEQYAEYIFTPEVENGTLAKVEIHAPIGSKDEWDNTAWTAINVNGDGSYTAKLVDGRSMVRVTAADGTEAYHSLRAYGVAINIEGENVDVSWDNSTYNITADVNDTVKISYKGLQMPFPKLGAIYNPGFPDKTYLEYNLKGLATSRDEEVISTRSQYGISGSNTITLTFDSPDTYILTKGGIRTSAFGERAGGHRAITKGGKTGVQSNYTGGNAPETAYGRFGSVPEIKLNITGIEDSGEQYTAAIKTPTDAGRLIIRNSIGYIKSAESIVNDIYTYSLYNNEGTETYAYALERPGYVTQIGTFDIKDKDVTIDLTSGWTPITQSGNTTVSIVGYESILSNNYTISISSSPDDLYAKYYVKYNHGGYTVLHALLEALEKNEAPFICKNGVVAPSITISQGEPGSGAGWICEVNGKVVTDYANTLVNGGDTVVFYYNQDTAENMRHAWFEETEVTAKRSGTAELTLISTPVANNGSEAIPVAGATVYVDGNEWAKTDSNGKVKLTNLKDLAIGPHTVTAQLDDTLTFARAVLIIEKDDSGTATSENTVKVTFRMIGDTKHEPAYNGYINWIKTEKHTVSKGTTMEELFVDILKEHGMKHDETSDNYVAWICAPPVLGGYKLGEFDNGANSGWMYTVDGYHPNLGLCEYILKDGDEIIWHYVNDYTLETSYEGSKPKYVNSWLVAKDTNPDGSMVDESQKNASNSKIDNSLSEKGTIVIDPSVTGKGGSAEVKINTSDMKSAVDQAKKNGNSAIVIQPKITGDVSKITVTLPKSSLSSMAEDTEADLRVVTPVGEINIPKAALASIVQQAAGTTVTVNMEKKDIETLSDEQKKAAGDKTVYDLSIISGDKEITEFNEKKITVSLPYTLKAGETAENVTVWYMDDKGELAEINCSYNKSTELVTFTTTKLSYFVIGTSEKQAEWNNPFTDVKVGDWFYEAVKYAVEKQLFSGTSETEFSPNAHMTRGMLVTVLYRMEGNPSVSTGNTFDDVEAGQWYTEAVIWANEKGIVTGYGEGKFGTNDPITREQMAAILYRYAEQKNYDVTQIGELTAYTDASSVSTWAAPAMKWAVSKGLITGTSSTELNPSGTATRAQVATILMRYAENIK